MFRLNQEKVADLAIERREGHENYGMGSITTMIN